MFNVLYLKELFTLPVGPNELGAQWYARARLGVRCLACYCWGAGAPSGKWLTYMSRCQELTAKFSITILWDIAQRLVLLDVLKINYIFECGPTSALTRS